MKTPILVALWLIVGTANIGVVNGAFRAHYPTLTESRDWTRQNFGFAVAFSLVTGPIGVVIAWADSGMWNTPYSWDASPTPCPKELEYRCDRR